jgi:CDP-4-dehydro-6-deoxyglucose reductase, E1
MSEKLEQILELVSEYIQEKDNTWTAGKDWISYSGPHYDEKEYLAAINVLLDGWLVFGENAREYEKQFPAQLGMYYGSLTNSGSSANLLAVTALKSKRSFNLKPGAKFITPVVCFPTTLNPIIQNGFEPVFVDVTLPDLNLDLDQVERILEADPDIKGIIFAHVLGNPPDMRRLMSLVKKYDLIFIEDACDALGSYYDGKKLGSFGHLSTCSFYPAHHMTMGEGGFVATNSKKLAKVVSSLRDWGRACYCNELKPGDVTSGTACGNRFKNWLTGMPEAVYDHRYVYDEIGYNLKPLDLQAAMGLQQLKKLPDLDAARRKNFAILQEIFKPYEKYLHLPQATELSDPCWFAYLLTVKEDAPFDRADIVDYLENEKIQTRSYFAGNILAHPGYRHLAEPYGDLNSMFPVAGLVTTNSFFLGTFIGLTEEKLAYIKKVVDSFFGAVR